MSETATETRSVVVEREIPYPPEKIWRALTQPHLIEGVAHEERLQASCGSPVREDASRRPPHSAMKKTTTTMTRKSASKEGKGGDSPSQLIDARIAALGDWRGETLARVRNLIKEADPEMVEEVKWRKPSNAMLGVPVWSHAGIICTGETYKDDPSTF
jgi:hypothetical protein